MPSHHQSKPTGVNYLKNVLDLYPPTGAALNQSKREACLPLHPQVLILRIAVPKDTICTLELYCPFTPWVENTSNISTRKTWILENSSYKYRLSTLNGSRLEWTKGIVFPRGPSLARHAAQKSHLKIIFSIIIIEVKPRGKKFGILNSRILASEMPINTTQFNLIKLTNSQ